MARGAWFGLAIVVLLNVLFGLAPTFWLDGREGDINELLELERRIERFPERDAVQVLVLGNSHAYTGLRPPDLARHLGLPPHGVFSLALPGSNPQEARLLIERYADRFPNARLVLCNVGVSFLNWHHEVRMRYLTRFSPAERWRMAAAESSPDARLGLMLSLAFPLFDFKEPIHRRLTGDPKNAGRRAREGRHIIAAMTYIWGLPIIYDHPALFEPQLHYRLQSRRELLQRARFMTASPSRIPAHATELVALHDALEARGVALRLVELPYPTALIAALDATARQKVATYRRTLAEVLASRKMTLLDTPDLPSLEAYYDGDHLNAEGAASVAATLGADPALRKLLQPR